MRKKQTMTYCVIKINAEILEIFTNVKLDDP